MLIQPPVTRPADFSAKNLRVTTFFPLGIAYLAASLEKTGKYELKIVDALIEGYNMRNGSVTGGGKTIRYGLTDKEIAKTIKDFSPDVVGVSCIFSAMEEDTGNICRIAKEVNSRIITVVGGAHAGAVADAFLQEYGAIDFIVIGEGEASFISLLEALKSGHDFSGLDGIAFRDKGAVHVLPKTKYIEDLDSLPFPARGLFAMKRYLMLGSPHSAFKNKPFTQMITSRGCPYNCAFCAIGKHWGKKRRMRSARNILDEIENLIKRHNIKEIHFEDDNLTADKKRAIELFDGMVKRRFEISWNAPAGLAVNDLGEELLVKMKASGCYSVSLGIESGNQEVLTKLMKKPVNLKTVPKLVREIRNSGMDVRGFFIIGYPGETKDTIKETIEFAKRLELDWTYFFIASPLPGTRMYKTCIEKGYIKEGDFDPIRSFHKSIIRTPEFTPEYLETVRQEAITDINFRNNPNLVKYDIQKAINDFKEVVERYPHFDFANFYLGEAYLKKGDKKNAVNAYKNTLSFNPSHREAKRRLEALKRNFSV